jgi:hypothetical protein
VDAAFWCWMVAAVLLVVAGVASELVRYDRVRAIAAKTISDQQVHRFVLYYQYVGFLWVLVGLTVAYLAYRTLQGDVRFRRAGVALSLSTIVLLLVWAVYASLPTPGFVASLALMAAVVLVMMPPARQWFNAVRQGGGDG